MSPNTTASADPNDLATLRDQLLARTIEWAAQESDFYAAHWGGAQQGLSSVQALGQLPWIDKNIALEHQAAMRCGPDLVTLGSISSGTTQEQGAEILRVEHCDAELEALENFREVLLGASNLQASSALTLQLVSPMHGFPDPAPPHVLRLVWAPYPRVPQLVQSMLQTEFSGRRIRELAISLGALKECTAYLASRDVDGPALGIEKIYTYGNTLTAYWRKRIEAFWDAELRDQYGLSEFRTLALDCGECGFYHFGIPPLIAEVIDPITTESVSAGIGELVLTGLFPFVQRQPLIRYRTGDLVAIGPPCARSPDRGLRPLGRIRQTAAGTHAGQYRAHLVPAAMENALEQIEGVDKHRTDFEQLCGNLGGAIGQPKAALSMSGEEPLLQVGINFDPLEHPNRAQKTREAISAAIEGSHAWLKDQAGFQFSATRVELRSPSAKNTPWIQKHAL